MTTTYPRKCEKCGQDFNSEKDWPVQTCPACWKAGFSVTKTGKVYERKKETLGGLIQQSTPATTTTTVPSTATNTAVPVTVNNDLLMNEIKMFNSRLSQQSQDMVYLIKTIEKSNELLKLILEAAQKP